jgi:hypothetical protein
VVSEANPGKMDSERAGKVHTALRGEDMAIRENSIRWLRIAPGMSESGRVEDEGSSGKEKTVS